MIGKILWQRFMSSARALRAMLDTPASEMGSALFEYMLKSENAWIRASAEFLLDTFGNIPNIEDLISEIQSQVEKLKSAETPKERTLRTRLGNSRGFLGAAVRDWFREIHSCPAPSYATFAERIVKPGDAVVTFNYDDSLERELRRSCRWDISRGYGFPLGTEELSSDVLVLKLHGSVNWLVSLFGGATGGAFLVESTFLDGKSSRDSSSGSGVP